MALSGMVVAARAQEVRRLSLDEAIRLGLELNPMIAAARAELSAADAGRREAEAARWPRLAAEAGWRRTDNQVLVFSDTLTAAEFTAADFLLDSLNHPEAQGHAAAAVGLEVPFDVSGRLSAGIAAGRAGAESARARLRAAEADLATRITEMYFGVTVAEGAVGVAAAALDDARHHEEVAAARVAAGAALSSDLQRARVERLGRERDLGRREADRDIARARLRTTLALPPGESVEPSSPLADPEGPLPPLDRFTAAPGAARPEIEAARRQAEAAAAAARAARSSLGPETLATARYERNSDSWDAGSGSYTVGVALRWNAFDRARAARIDQAAARAAAVAAQSRAAEDGARLEVEVVWRDVETADRSLSLAREAVAAAQEARRIDAERYAAGMLRLAELLDTETALVAARFDELGARYDAVVGRTRLRRAAGLLEVPR
jgi:outer membrane protein TolC